MNKFKKYKYIFSWTSIKKGILKGISIPLLPDSISRVYNLPLVRVLRVIGGFSAILVLTKNYTYLPNILHWVVLVLGLIQLIQIVIISIIKVIFGIRKWIKNPEEFEVRNSPLNKYATQIANLAFCWKVGCAVVGGGVGMIGGGVAIDQLLEAGGQPKIFLPFMGSGVKFIFGNNLNSDPSIVYDNIQKNLRELGSAEDRQEYIAKYIDKISYEDLKKHNISEADMKDIKKALKEIYELNDKDLKLYRSKILSEIEKLRNNVNK
jgi:Nitric oxide reductase large subunit